MITHHGMFVATCERCGDGVALTRTQQDLFIGPRGQFTCGSCGGMKPVVKPVVRRASRPRTVKPKETRCCLKGQEPPTYFRACPDCPEGL